MSKLLVRSVDTGQSGVFAEVSAARAGWDLLNMAALRLFSGETYQGSVGEHEHISVVLGGRCVLTVEGERFDLGQRPDVFSGMPHAFYLPRGKQFELEAVSDMLEIVSCWVPSDQDFPLSIIRPEQCAVELRGGGNASRQINSILPPGSACHRLVCVEVYTPSGNWSSYPPHKHDEHRVDAQGNLLEADLEEIYFYKLSHPQGIAYQRVYTGDGSLDELCLARNHDLVLVPEGYHPVVSGHGYHTYYCNFLAGSAQSLANSDDPDHAWVKEHWKEIDPRLPLVKHS